MISHILVPLDGSSLAECVLPHIGVIARAMDAEITLLHILEHPRKVTGALAIDPFDWHLRKSEAGVYLRAITERLQAAGLSKVESLVVEGSSAEGIIDYANTHHVDLIALSTHGSSGLTGWSISSVVQKIIQRAHRSTLLVRAYKSSPSDLTEMSYRRLFVGLDCSARAEFVLPVAISLANFYHAQLMTGTVISQPQVFDRFPLSQEDAELVKKLVDRNYRMASHYLGQIHSQFSQQGIDLQTRLAVSDDIATGLHDMVDRENVDLTMLVAHGHSGYDRWPFGSIATSFINYGSTALMIMQDLSGNELKQTQAELVVKESKGH